MSIGTCAVLKRLARGRVNPSIVAASKDKHPKRNARDQDASLATAITGGGRQLRITVRLLCFDNVPVLTNTKTLEALKAQYLPAQHDHKPACLPSGNPRFKPLQMSADDVNKCLRTFSAVSASGPDGLTITFDRYAKQHFK